MELTAQVANHLHQARFDECVHIFRRLLVEIMGAGLTAFENRLERGLDPLRF